MSATNGGETETFVHSSAVVEPGARLGVGVRVGPFYHIGPAVELGDGVELVSHVVVAGRTSIGAHSRAFPFASLGHPPQNLKYRGEPSSLSIGAKAEALPYIAERPHLPRRDAEQPRHRHHSRQHCHRWQRRGDWMH